MNYDKLLSDRSRKVEVSGIRKVFDLARTLKDPVNLSIGQPHFPVPEPIKQAAVDAINGDHNGYTVTQGIAPLRDRILHDLKKTYPAQDRDVVITSGTSGGILLALLAVIDPGDEIIIPDPYFVGYPHFATMTGGIAVYVDTYPTFELDPQKIRDAITPRTKAILFSTPGNPTGAVIPPDTQKEIVEIARKQGVLVISDEIYKAFHYDTPPHSPAEHDENVLVIEGFGKTYGITGWRLGYAHGPKAIIDEMMKLQQFSYVCAPSIAQHAGVAALDYDVTAIVADYKRKRDTLAAGLSDKYEFAVQGGAFYLFVKVPGERTGTEFVSQAIERNLLIIPGGSFSRQDDYFRISYAASDDTLHRGIEILNSMA